MTELIEGLPDAVALRCLARVPLGCHSHMRAVCRSWRSAVKSPELFKLRIEAGAAEEWLYVSAYDPEKLWQAYDPMCDHWFTLPPLPSCIKHLSNFGTAALSGKLYVIGGGSDDVDPVTGDRGGIIASNEVWVYDPVCRTWDQRSPMLMARAQFAFCVLDRYLFVAGGFTTTRKFVATAEIYDPEINKWMAIAEMKQMMSSPCSCVVLEGKVYVVHNEVPMAQVYEPLDNRWLVVDSLQSCIPMAVLNGEPYMLFNGIVSNARKEAVLRGPIGPWSVWFSRAGYGFTFLSGELYVVGGVRVPRPGDFDIKPLNDVWICNLDGEQPVWREGVSMTLAKGTILGCVVLKL